MKKSILITCISTFFIAMALFTSLLLDAKTGSRVSQIVTIITALIGAAALFVQFIRDKKINQVSFILDFSKSFYDPINLGEVMNKLEEGTKTAIDFDKNYNDIVNYLQWCETLSSLIVENVFSFKTIDAVFSYRFFVITNDPVVQKKELIPYKEFYENIYLVHKRWTEYKNKHRKKIVKAETSLSETSDYVEFIKRIKEARM